MAFDKHDRMVAGRVRVVQVSRKMSDIARLAGVSEATVSRALRGSTLISQATRERIQEIAETVGYTVDHTARNLRLQRTGAITVAVPLHHEVDQGISDPFFLEMLGFLADELADRGYDLLLRKIGADEPNGLAALVTERRSDGILLIGQSTQHAQIKALAQHYKPLVVWGADMGDGAYITVGSDNRAGGRMAVEHLLKLGHRRIAFFGDRELPEVAARFEGYHEALAAAGVKWEPALECRVTFKKAGSHAAISDFLKTGTPFDAVFAASDQLAGAAINIFDRHGLKVPRDVAVVGFDDLMLAAAYTSALTTVHQDLAAGARLMVNKLFKRMTDEDVRSTLVPVRLIVRASCGGNASPSPRRRRTKLAVAS